MNAENHWADQRPLPFLNVSGETVPACAVMAVTGVVHEHGVAFLQCAKPSATFHREYAVNNLFDVPAGLCGTCFDSGNARALYDSGSPAANEGWGPRPGEWQLTKGYPGFAVQGTIDGSHRIARVVVAPLDRALVRTTAAIAASATTTQYRVYAGTLGSEVDAGFTSVPSARNRAAHALPNGAWAWLAWMNNGWELLSVETPSRVARGATAEPIAAAAVGEIIVPGLGYIGDAENWSDVVAAAPDDKILAWRDPHDDLYYFVKAGGRGTRLFKATLAGTLSNGDATASVNTTAALDGGPHPGAITAQNPLGLSGPNGSPCRVVEDLSGGGDEPAYELLQVKHVKRTPLVSATWTGTALQVARQDITVMHEGDPQSAETLFSATTATVLEDVTWSSPNLERQSKTVLVLGASAPSTSTIVATAEATYVSDVNFSAPNLTYDTRKARVLADASGTTGNAILTATLKTVVESVAFATGDLIYHPVSLYVLGSIPGSTEVILSVSIVENVIDVAVDGLDLVQTKQVQYVFGAEEEDDPDTILEGRECDEEAVEEEEEEE